MLLLLLLWMVHVGWQWLIMHYPLYWILPLPLLHLHPHPEKYYRDDNYCDGDDDDDDDDEYHHPSRESR